MLCIRSQQFAAKDLLALKYVVFCQSFTQLTRNNEPLVVDNGTAAEPLQLGTRFSLAAAAHFNHRRSNERLFRKTPASTSWLLSSRVDSNRIARLRLNRNLFWCSLHPLHSSFQSPVNRSHPLRYASRLVPKQEVPPESGSALTFRERKKKRLLGSAGWRDGAKNDGRQSAAGLSNSNHQACWCDTQCQQ